MVKEKVLAGRYKDLMIVYDHIKNPASDDIYFNTFSVKTFEIADKSKNGIWGDIARDAARAAEAGMEKDHRLVSVEWRDGEKSLLQLNSKTCNRLMETLFGRIPQEFAQEPVQEEEKSKSSKAIIFIVVAVIIFVVVKFFIL